MIKTKVRVFCVRCIHCNPVDEPPYPVEVATALDRAKWIAFHKRKHRLSDKMFFSWTESKEAILR